MANIEDNLEEDTEELKPSSTINRKKILIFLIPVLIVIGLVVSFYSVFSKKINNNTNEAYTIIDKSSAEAGNNSLLVLYDLPQITVQLKSDNNKTENAVLRLNIELSNIEDAKIIEGLMPEINDAILAHLIELTSDEISDTEGLYWLKEELLYRINLIVAPIKVSNLNFKSFEIIKN